MIVIGGHVAPYIGEPFLAPSGRLCWCERINRTDEGTSAVWVYEQDDGSLDPDDTLTLCEQAWHLLRRA